ncbi:(Fe-S)-binding protein [Bacillus pumilus]|uniref:(Fe-S)-binding protein n=1 Tax=Bacillus TaxID=1386 RepID=UPI0010BEA081|nr:MULTISPECIES: (Fe-S)-binding protein [Bacillus]MDR6747581.1 glycolate oxidase iron-sulfur subunit [Bacillus pumilus]TKI23734.1 (Fe-S)-binding protein [Bacillus pumilus]
MTVPLNELREELQYDKTKNCVQCGYCLPVCPTYVTFGTETHSPRGRINLVKMVGEGKITDLSVLEEPLNLCLGCRACETACPTGVEYGSILEAARAAIVKRKKFSLPVRLLRKVMLKKVIPNKKMMNVAGHSIWLYKTSGLQKAARASGIMKNTPYNLGEFESIIPTPTSPIERSRASTEVKAKLKAKYTVAFFTGCIMDSMFHTINQLSIKLLSEVGCDVVVVPKQTCCGALQAHTGEMDEARHLAKQNILAFEQINADFIVNNAGGCGAQLYEYGHLLSNDKEWAEKAAAFSAKSRDISQVLVACGGLPDLQPRHGERVTYQHSCHMTNVQKVNQEPLELLKSIPGIQFIEMEQANMCCGSAGIYNIVNYDASMQILDEKMKHTKATNATVVITTNPGCLLQMKLGIEREGLSHSMRALHLIEYLAEASGIS